MLLGHRMGCHQRPDRSFFFRGRQFPLCARCTGVLLGYFLAIPLYVLVPADMDFCLKTAAIMLIDWLLQFSVGWSQESAVDTVWQQRISW